MRKRICLGVGVLLCTSLVQAELPACTETGKKMALETIEFIKQTYPDMSSRYWCQHHDKEMMDIDFLRVIQSESHKQAEQIGWENCGEENPRSQPGSGRLTGGIACGDGARTYYLVLILDPSNGEGLAIESQTTKPDSKKKKPTSIQR